MPTAGQMRFETREVGQVVIADLGGNVVMGQEAMTLRKMLRERLDQQRPMLLNLSGIQYMDSTGVGALVEAKAHAIGIGQQFRVCHVPPFVSRVLRELHLSEILEVCPTEAEALARYT